MTSLSIGPVHAPKPAALLFAQPAFCEPRLELASRPRSVLSLPPTDSQQRLQLTSVLNSITSARSIAELTQQTQLALPQILPCENFVFASGRVRAHRVFFSHLIHPDSVSDDLIKAIVGRDGMIPPLGIDPIEHCGRPKFTTLERLGNSSDPVWAKIFREHGIRNLGWTLLPGLHRNTFTGYFFHNISATVAHESKMRMMVFAPYLHIALNRALGSKLLRHNPGPNHQLLSILSSREAEISRWVARGKTNWEIGQILGISDKTVKTHLQNIFSKLQASSRAQIAALFCDE
ncbi:Response regulator containing a CheY-like receiver domain and an HTH DNA-binding domain [Pseudomonas sp. LAMO17WK12:I10]|uniref:LuxR C-terminal-related transcriptional regulator n=1 Tax=unclassified Pseudomonas TaxID=196821 RepID=UPI000BDD1089|nr:MULTISPECIES: LuxR C-terminal-related transcriptional regulator [unclassified Pseudomonas]PXX55727.1 regulatory LuxR family protein [Pseudomonas sp. LAMO17WK12:I9]SNY50596.1 Response regulator containing a CheY-like receiver domain and an HTH DNA-binding domain [Pseudomonas sp. LAMO17WK12:I10]